MTFDRCSPKQNCTFTSRRHAISLLILLLSITLLCHQFSTGMAEPPNPSKISPLPPMYLADHEEELFDVDIVISEAAEAYSCGFTITYDPALLRATHAYRGTFFPQDAQFQFSIDEPAGLVQINMSLSGSHEPVSGNGVLARISFEIAAAPPESVGSPLRILSLHLYDQNHAELDHKSVSAVFFWQSVQPREPDGERQVDLFTQKGGEGPGKWGGWFGYGGQVILRAYASYAGWPEQNALVAFQVLNPLNETALVIITETDESGIAETSFNIPMVPESVGVWTAISSVDIACTVVWDTLTFTVSTPIGGETVPIEASDGTHIYLAVVGVLAIGLTAARRSPPQHHGDRTPKRANDRNARSQLEGADDRENGS